MCTFYVSLVPLTLSSVTYVLSDVYAARQQQKYWKEILKKSWKLFMMKEIYI